MDHCLGEKGAGKSPAASVDRPVVCHPYYYLLVEIAPVDSVLLDNGSVSAVAATTTELDSGGVRTFTGTYGGAGQQGTWNLSLKGDQLTCTWSGSNSSGGYRGGASGTLTGSTISLPTFWQYDDATQSAVAMTGSSATGSLTGSFLCGLWNVAGGRGFWSGLETDANGDTRTVQLSDSIETRSTVLTQILGTMAGSVDFTGSPPFHNVDGTVTATITVYDASTWESTYTVVNYVDTLFNLTANGYITSRFTMSDQRQTYFSESLTFSGTFATSSLGITSIDAVVSIDYTSRTATGYIYFNGITTNNYISSYQALLFP